MNHNALPQSLQRPGTAPAVPESPTLHRLPVNGITLASWEWRPQLRGQQPTLLLVHATGFHGRVWDQVVRHLPDRHVIAVEQRCHGRSDATLFANWDVFGRDLAAVAVAWRLDGAQGVGHSMGGHALVCAASLAPTCFERLMLIDPVLRAPDTYLQAESELGPLHPSAGRKNRFESPQAMFTRFADRLPYAVFDPQALRDYCEYGLIQNPEGDGDSKGWRLACDPLHEASVYTLARQNPGVYASIRALKLPVLVVRARDMDPGILPWDPLGSPTWAGLAAEFAQGRDLHLTDKTHLLPMEDPALVARLIDGWGQGQEAVGPTRHPQLSQARSGPAIGSTRTPARPAPGQLCGAAPATAPARRR